MNDPMSVEGKHVLITGGTSGIGLGGATYLAQRGADVIISGTRETGAEIAGGIGARFIQCDVSKFENVKNMIETAAEMFGGKIDALFLNAGRNNDETMIDETTPERMRWLFEVNFDHAYAGIHYAIPHMAEYGSIAVTTSPAANVTTASYSSYSAAKAAAKMLCRTAAIELGPRRIRVNSLNPGAVITEMQYPGKHDWPIVKSVIVGDVRKPIEMGPFFQLLASDASRPMTGAELLADDGISAGISLNALGPIVTAAMAEEAEG